MASKIQTIAEALKSAIASQTFSQSFAITRKHVPLLADAPTVLTVTVAARVLEMNRLDRGGSTVNEYTFDIGIQKMLPAGVDPSDAGSNTTLDAFDRFCEEVAEFLTPAQDSDIGATWVKTKREPIVGADELRAGMYVSLITVTYMK